MVKLSGSAKKGRLQECPRYMTREFVCYSYGFLSDTDRKVIQLDKAVGRCKDITQLYQPEKRSIDISRFAQ